MDKGLSTDDIKTEAQAWFSQGVILGKRKEYEKALAYFQKTIELHPKHLHAWYNKGVLYVQMKKYLDAMHHFNQILEIDPHYPDAWINKALILELLGDDTKHEQDRTTKYIESMECLDQTLALYERLETQEKDKTHEHPPRSMLSSIWNHKGFILSKIGDCHQAIECFRNGLSLNPHDFYTWNNQGILYLNQNQHPQALSSFEKALELNPRFIPAWINRALIYKRENRIDESLLVGMFVNLFSQKTPLSVADLSTMIQIKRPFLEKKQKAEFVDTLINVKRLFSFNPENKKFLRQLILWIENIPVKQEQENTD